jgi:uncharacterized protein (UPF0332 family)
LKPETARFLEKARNLLTQADAMLGVGLNDAAGRTAYLAGYNAAKALLFQHRNLNYTSHGRVQTEFAKLAKDDERVAPHLRAFLSSAYNLKRIADYETGPGSEVSTERAKEATATAHQFVACIASLLPPNGHTPPLPEAAPKP